jgi:putative transposase
VCNTLDYSRQGYYKQNRAINRKNQITEKITKLVNSNRKLLPRVGTRKIYKLIKPEMDISNIKCGRDKLFEIMRSKGLLVKPRRRYIKTTLSKHWMRKYPNLIKQMDIKSPEQVWVSDITYIKTEEGNCYLSMITDAFSRKIMGYNVSDSMETSQSIKALKMAIKNRHYLSNKVIHHSDRGLQYCSKEYVKLAAENNIQMSMTEQSDPYENALAERMNRTIKEEFCLDSVLKNKEQVYKVLDEAVSLYNDFRPHQALLYLTPNNVHKKPRHFRATGDL